MSQIFGTFQTDLVLVTCWCGTPHAITRELDGWRRRTGGSVHCPLGHTYVVDGEVKRLNGEIERLRAVVGQKLAEVASAEAAARAARGQVTKLKKRVAHGVCPHCTRHFTNVERHIATKHPEAKAATA